MTSYVKLRKNFLLRCELSSEFWGTFWLHPMPRTRRNQAEACFQIQNSVSSKKLSTKTTVILTDLSRVFSVAIFDSKLSAELSRVRQVLKYLIQRKTVIITTPVSAYFGVQDMCRPHCQMPLRAKRRATYCYD